MFKSTSFIGELVIEYIYRQISRFPRLALYQMILDFIGGEIAEKNLSTVRGEQIPRSRLSDL